MKNMSFISFSLTETPSLHSCKAQKKAWRSPEAASRFSIATRLKLENLQRWAAPPPTSGSVWKFHPKWSVHVIGYGINTEGYWRSMQFVHRQTRRNKSEPKDDQRLLEPWCNLLGFIALTLTREKNPLNFTNSLTDNKNNNKNVIP
ncbi:uncharacterized protein LOC119590789 [Penaeus monodon]|uniref:uncharacterized protein LOC119590789 n=1 Tax=Penaeus monodon TaxID=6687 RepID=UPI0018A79873|nr:uncharacterized protein LOC119590789 [Penaeus monodon]